jgi:hypothetical protein
VVGEDCIEAIGLKSFVYLLLLSIFSSHLDPFGFANRDRFVCP